MRFSGGFETKKLGYRGTKDVKVKHTYARALAGSEGKGEVHLEVNVATGRISCGMNRGQTSNGALANATLTTGNGDDLLHIWNASLWR